MSFADDLREKSNAQELVQQQKQREEEERQAQYEDRVPAFYRQRQKAIESGELAETFYAFLKEKIVNTENIGQEYCGEVIYLPTEFAKKEEDYEAKKDSFNEMDDEGLIGSKAAYYSYIVPHTVFSEVSCGILQKQLSRLFELDGFRYAFALSGCVKRRGVHIEYDCSEEENPRLYGKSLKFRINWYPWDIKKPLTSDALTKIKDLCVNFMQDKGNTIHDFPKLLNSLSLQESETYFCDDSTIFKSGKEGVAITANGFYSIKGGRVKQMCFQDIADCRFGAFGYLEYCYGPNADEHYEILRRFPLNLEDIQGVVRKDLMP